MRHLPNLLCVLRMLLVVPVAAWLLEQRYAEVMVLFGIAAFTDALDGLLAKRFGWTSELGKLLDPMADKLLLMTVFVCLSIVGLAPWWLTALVWLRDLVIVIGAGVYKRLFGDLHGRPTLPSKLNTLLQILFCLALVAGAAYGWPGAVTITVLGAAVLVTTAVSGIDYTLIYSRRAARVARARRAA
jgi:cardiolipin synthase